MRYVILLALVLAVPIFAQAQISLPYGESAGQVNYYNEKNQEFYQEPYPIGPLSFRLDGEHIWVADSVGIKMLKLTRNSEIVSEFSVKGEAEARMIEDFALVKNEESQTVSIWFIDAMFNILVNYSVSGEELGVIASDELIQPSFIEVSSSGHIYVADKAAQAILIFNANGEFVTRANWEWSGMAISASSDMFYRLFYEPESENSFLVAQDLNDEILAEIEVKLPPHTNPELWMVDEEKQEMLITCTPITGFAGTFIVLRCGFDGEIKGQSTIAPPFVMNRYIDMQSFEDAWIGVANYEKAPEGAFRLEPVKLP